MAGGVGRFGRCPVRGVAVMSAKTALPTIRVVQTAPEVFVARCSVHGDFATYTVPMAASFACAIHAAVVFHGEGAR